MLCVGGLSVVAMLILLGSGPEGIDRVLPSDGGATGQLFLERSVILTLLLNAPHFMASYGLLYYSQGVAARYRSASLYVPAFLLVYAIWTIYNAVQGRGGYVDLLLVVMGVYLALHYTGQVWGMMASFSYLDGTPFEPRERFLLRNSLWVLCFWQIGWTLVQLDAPVAWLAKVLPGAMELLNWLLVLTLIPVSFAFWSFCRRHKKAPSGRVILPLGALYLWYAAIAQDPRALFWVQISHALQYIIFPLRVEANRYTRGNEGSTDGLSKQVPLRDRCSFGRFPWLISQALSATYVAGELRLYLERNCRLPESPSRRASRGACQFQGAEP